MNIADSLAALSSFSSTLQDSVRTRRAEFKSLRGVDSPTESQIVDTMRPTMERLSGESDQSILPTFIQEIDGALVLPEDLKSAEVRAWLQDERESLLRTAAMQLIADETNTAQAGSLVDSLVIMAQVEKGRAGLIVESVLACLKAAFLSKLDPGQHLIYNQGIDIRKRLDRLEQFSQVPSLSDAGFLRYCEDLATDEYLATKQLAEFGLSIKRRILELASRVNGGDLDIVDAQIKNKIYYLAARKTVEEGTATSQVYLNRIRGEFDSCKLKAQEGLRLAADSDIDASIRLLRSEENSDCRATLLYILQKHKGAETAVEWAHKEGIADPPFDRLTGSGYETYSSC